MKDRGLQSRQERIGVTSVRENRYMECKRQQSQQLVHTLQTFSSPDYINVSEILYK